MALKRLLPEPCVCARLWVREWAEKFPSTSIPGPSRWDGDEDPGKIRFIVPQFWEKNRMRSETQPYSTVLQYGCVALRMWCMQHFACVCKRLHTSNIALQLAWVEHNLQNSDHAACLTWSQCSAMSNYNLECFGLISQNVRIV